MFLIGFIIFRLRNLGSRQALARLSLAKQNMCKGLYRGNSEGNVHCFNSFSNKLSPPSSENSKFSMKSAVYDSL